MTLGKEQNITKEVLTTFAYKQDNMLALYDGIENAGISKHEKSADVWKNLVTSSAYPYDIELHNAMTFGSFMHFNGVDAYGIAPKLNAALLENGFSFEICMKSLDTTTRFGWLYSGSGCRPSAYVSSNTINVYPFSGSQQPITVSYDKPFATISVCFGKTYGHVGLNGVKITEADARLSITTQTTNNRLRVAVGGSATDTNTSFSKMQVYSIRIYDQLLTADDLLHNYTVDKARFMI